MSNPVLRYNLDTLPESRWITVMASQVARSDLLYAQEIGDFLCGKDYYTYRHGLQSYQIILSIGGKGYLQYRDKEFDVPAGSFIWLNCMEPQHYRTCEGCDQWHTVWVHLYGATADAYYRLFDTMNGGSPIAEFGGDVTMRSLIDMLLKLYAVPGTTLREDIRAASLLTQLLTRCIQTVNSTAGTERVPVYVQSVRSYIELHYTERITLDSLASAISINKFYLQKLFKQTTGMSPNEYLISIRLNRAKQLLRTTDCPIADVAVQVGISNIGHFVELFKRYEGSTPGAYRHKWYSGDIHDEK